MKIENSKLTKFSKLNLNYAHTNFDQMEFGGQFKDSEHKQNLYISLFSPTFLVLKGTSVKISK